jgi:hypothetical protein
METESGSNGQRRARGPELNLWNPWHVWNLWNLWNHEDRTTNDRRR